MLELRKEELWLVQLCGLNILGHFGLVEWEMMQKRGVWMPELLKELRERGTELFRRLVRAHTLDI